jgi:uncharacterized membrane protein YkoI
MTMKLTATLAILPIAALATGAALAAAPHGPPAKLTMAQARVIALKAAPGKIVESDYEKEKGAWRYSFDIRQGTRVHEVGVDANNGKIVESSYETAGDKD